MDADSVKNLVAGWRHVRLTEVARLESGHTPSKRQPDYWGGAIPWVSLHDTEGLDAWEIQTTNQSITEAGLANSSARLLPKGTVVFSRTATVGKSTVMGRAMATSQDFACYVCGPEVHNFYLALLLRSMRAEWKKLMAGSIHNTVYMPVFKTLSVDLPPHGEQVAIANAMRDAERLIDSLEQLLTKKRQIKQGAMQELLTGKRRLEGFHQEWRNQPFAAVLERINAKRNQIQASEYQNVGTLPVVDQGQTTPVAYSDAVDARFKCPTEGVLIFGDHTCITKFVNFDFVVGADGVQVLTDPAYFAKMSALLDEIIRLRKEKAIEYEDYLARIAEVAKKVSAGKADDTPQQVKTAGQLALYNNLKDHVATDAAQQPDVPWGDTNKALHTAMLLDAAIKAKRPDGWRGVVAKEQMVKQAMFDVLKDIKEVNRLFPIVFAQKEY